MHVPADSIIVIWLASWFSRSDTHMWAGGSRLSQIIFPQHNKQYPACLVPAHLQFNQFTKPILPKTFQHWKGQGCYIRHIKTECSIISKSIAVSVGVLNCERIDTLPLPHKGCTSDTDDAQRRKNLFSQIIWNCPLNFPSRSKAAYRQQFCVGRPLAPLILGSSDPVCLCVSVWVCACVHARVRSRRRRPHLKRTGTERRQTRMKVTKLPSTAHFTAYSLLVQDKQQQMLVESPI